MPTLEAIDWGRQLRFSAPPRLIEKFYSEFADHLADFLVFGSGDFHHLTGLWLRRLTRPTVLISFDNHPDWDVRPPKWCCGSWINRALELPQVQHAAIWGCGNFECWWPGQIFGNRRAEREGKLEVHPWADDHSEKDRERRGAILRGNWREHFDRFVDGLAGASVYVTIDLDCLRSEDAMTNWENGQFTTSDVAWALDRVQAKAEIVAGDICGAFSRPAYARWKQRFASEMDHPKLENAESGATRRVNQAAFAALWPALTQRDNENSDADQNGSQN